MEKEEAKKATTPCASVSNSDRPCLKQGTEKNIEEGGRIDGW